MDATLVEVHSDKERRQRHFKGGFGYHPLLAFLDNTNEALAGILRPGRRRVQHRRRSHRRCSTWPWRRSPTPGGGKPILVRSDGAGFSHALLTHLAARFGVLGRAGRSPRRSGPRSPPCVRRSWSPAVETDGELRDGADVAEVTGLLDLSGWPPGMRIIVRRERPHPGAQLERVRAPRRLPLPNVRHQHPTRPRRPGVPRSPPPRPRAGRGPHPLRQDTGLGRLPSREMAINAAWLELVLTATDLTAWLQTSLLTDHPALAQAEPKALRYRLLHTAARITRGRPADLPARVRYVDGGRSL